MNNFDLNYVRHLINGIVSLIKSLEYLPERYPRFELLKKETNVRYAIYKKYKIPSLTVEKVKSARKPLFKV